MERKFSYYASRIALALGGLIVVLAVGLFVASFFLDGFIRPRIENAMNEKLRGYHTTLAHAHLQLIGGRLTLRALKVIQEKHPRPPVADIREMRFTIQWRQLFSGHVVADVMLWRPKVHIDTAQFQAEAKSKTPLRKKGWQDALENVYPFKINRFTIRDGDVAYIDATDPQRPIHLERLNFTADNIRNIHARDSVYPSPIHASATVFGKGHAKIDGHANFLAEPFPGLRVTYEIREVPLSAVDPASNRVNVSIQGGTLRSQGLVEYSAKVARVDVDDAVLDDVAVNYVHAAETANKEAQTVNQAGKKIEKENNRAQVVIRVKRFDITHSSFGYTDRTKNPNYKLFLNDTAMKLANFSNHEANGPARIDLRGKFMGSGDTTLSGDFLSSEQGPYFNLNLAIRDAQLPAMNDLLRAYGRFDVQAGLFSLFTQMGVKDGAISGYVKPMFSDLEVYSWQKDKNKSLPKQAYELALGGAAKLFKNSRTQKVATQFDLNGRLKNPNVSTWQAVIEVLHNAFIQAILPGFDREAQSARAQSQ